MKTKSSVRAQAARWLFAFETTDSFEELWPRFQAWLNEDVRHREAYLSLEKAWRQVASLSGLGPDNEVQDPDILFKLDLRRQSPATTSTWTSSRAIGALSSITVAAFLVWWGSGALQHEMASVAHRFLLPREDSAMTLNAPRRVLPGLARRSRDLGVLRGEVFLKAQQAPRRMYGVRGADTVLDADGTQFSLGQMSDDVFDALVEEGRLALTPVSLDTADPKPDSPVILEAGQGAVIDEEGIHPQSLDSAEVRDRLSWRQGK